MPRNLGRRLVGGQHNGQLHGADTWRWRRGLHGGGARHHGLPVPKGTLWRLDVAPTAQPVSSGLRYGDPTAGSTVTWPISGEAPALVSGQTYYLVALLDIYQPATRCLFQAP